MSFGEPASRITKVLGRGVATRLDGHRLRFYPKVGIYVDYGGTGANKVGAIILTRSSRYKTLSGIGVGSSVRQLRSHIRVTCDRGSLAPSQCQHQGANVNQPLTVFNIDLAKKRVVEVAIAPGGD